MEEDGWIELDLSNTCDFTAFEAPVKAATPAAVVDILGGQERLSALAVGTATESHLYLRPNDKICKPMKATASPQNDVLVSLTYPAPGSASSSGGSIQAHGVVVAAYQHKGLADLVYRPRYEPASNHLDTYTRAVTLDKEHAAHQPLSVSVPATSMPCVSLVIPPRCLSCPCQILPKSFLPSADMEAVDLGFHSNTDSVATATKEARKKLSELIPSQGAAASAAAAPSPQAGQETKDTDMEAAGSASAPAAAGTPPLDLGEAHIVSINGRRPPGLEEIITSYVLMKAAQERGARLKIVESDTTKERRLSSRRMSVDGEGKDSGKGKGRLLPLGYYHLKPGSMPPVDPPSNLPTFEDLEMVSALPCGPRGIWMSKSFYPPMASRWWWVPHCSEKD